MRTPRPFALAAAALTLLAGAPAGALAQSTTERQAIAAASDLSAAFRYAAHTIQPSVVSVYSSREEPGYVRDVFGRTFRQDRESTGLGSGVVIDADGHILTNNHVVEGADALKVSTPWGEQVDATLVATDPRTDLAVVKIDPGALRAGELSPAALGDSDALQVGDWVIAVGSPLGLEQTVTAGIVSAIDRREQILGDNGYEAFIQTDAAINPGNSGGPLVNLKGEVVGINSAIRTAGPAGGSIGLGFSIPMSIARSVAQDLIETGYVRRGFLGVSASPLTPDAATQLNLPASTRGVVISAVGENSPAETAGLRRGDVITAINDRPVLDFQNLRLNIASLRPGERVALDVLRPGGEHARLTAVIADQTINFGEPLGLAITDSGDRGARLAKELGVRGAMVAQVDPGLLAEDADLREGDIIVGFNNKRIESPERLREMIESLRYGAVVRMDVLSKDGTPQQKVLRIPRR